MIATLVFLDAHATFWTRLCVCHDPRGILAFAAVFLLPAANHIAFTRLMRFTDAREAVLMATLAGDVLGSAPSIERHKRAPGRRAPLTLWVSRHEAFKHIVSVLLIHLSGEVLLEHAGAHSLVAAGREAALIDHARAQLSTAVHKITPAIFGHPVAARQSITVTPCNIVVQSHWTSVQLCCWSECGTGIINGSCSQHAEGTSTEASHVQTAHRLVAGEDPFLRKLPLRFGSVNNWSGN